MKTRLLRALLLVLLLPVAAAAGEAPPALLTLERVAVTPTDPGPDTLCQLRVTLRNQGTQPASELAFEVRVNGQDLPVYQRHLFMQRLDPGASTEVRLFNFWSTETGRPAPASGKYEVQVALLAARWYTIAQQGDEEVWTPGEAVAGLPSRAGVTVGR